MSINLNDLLRRQLPPNDGTPVFKFEKVGDQVIAKFIERRTFPKSPEETVDLIEVDIIAGEKMDYKKEPIAVKPGRYIIYLGTHQRQLLDRRPPDPGQALQMRLCEIGKRNFKKFGYDLVELE